MASSDQGCTLRDLECGRHRPCSLVEVPTDCVGSIPLRDAVNPDEDVENLADVHHRHLALPSVELCRDDRAGSVPHENADQRACVEHYSP